MKLQWGIEYELGIGVIDDQHKRIVEYINDVDLLQSNQADRSQMQQVLYCLIDYTQSHFAFEEALLEQVGYSDLAEHQLCHNTFIQQIEQLHQNFLQGQDVADRLADMLLKWLLGHIRSDDHSYSQVVKAYLLKQDPQAQTSWFQRAMKKYFA